MQRTYEKGVISKTDQRENEKYCQSVTSAAFHLNFNSHLHTLTIFNLGKSTPDTH